MNPKKEILWGLWVARGEGPRVRIRKAVGLRFSGDFQGIGG